jgi:hypothetical protein
MPSVLQSMVVCEGISDVVGVDDTKDEIGDCFLFRHPLLKW